MKSSGLSSGWIGLHYSDQSYSWPTINQTASLYLNTKEEAGTGDEEIPTKNAIITSADGSWLTVASESIYESVVCMGFNFSAISSTTAITDDAVYFELTLQLVDYVAENYHDSFEYLLLKNSDPVTSCEDSNLDTAIILNEILYQKVLHDLTVMFRFEASSTYSYTATLAYYISLLFDLKCD